METYHASPAGADRGSVHHGAQDSHSQCGDSGDEPFRWKPAESAAGPLARDGSARAHPRRTDARHRHLRKEGRGVLFISSELEEVVRSCARIMVLRDRRRVGELEGAAVTENAVMEM